MNLDKNITYTLDIYLYPHNNYTNDLSNSMYDLLRNSPDYFYYSHAKNSSGYGKYKFKSNKNKLLDDFQTELKSILDLESIENNLDFDLESIENN